MGKISAFQIITVINYMCILSWEAGNEEELDAISHSSVNYIDKDVKMYSGLW